MANFFRSRRLYYSVRWVVNIEFGFVLNRKSCMGKALRVKDLFDSLRVDT